MNNRNTETPLNEQRAKELGHALVKRYHEYPESIKRIEDTRENLQTVLNDTCMTITPTDMEALGGRMAVKDRGTINDLTVIANALLKAGSNLILKRWRE